MSENTKTLLQITQDIMSGMDMDIVNSINDTPEAGQVATIIKNTFFNIIRRKPWPWMTVVTPLMALGDTTQPTKMQIPLNMNRVDKLQFNAALKADTDAGITRFKTLDYLFPDEFLDLTSTRVTNGDSIIAYNMDNGTPLNIITKIPPNYWTSFDENFIYFDSWDSSQTSSITSAYTIAYGAQEPSWTHEDSFIPQIPQEMFSLLEEMARATCSARLRQVEDKIAESEAMKQYNTFRLNSYKVRGGMRFKDFGRWRIR